ncbi:hypothetical protein GCM10010193_00230 [Kitasatospora atroaurantiaca]|uniref:Uncharacterized protein n=1 Tax=Kitasatospora atroaurantiaca TaxID=285545 RepID=A0A561EK92_9ACTN|nr:hypothetical protein [Kitasatospora atroaurantiaca]TWE16033.1 hypothetical protein FB465_0992 [Kitasatospora atroaurantiaca]
MADVFDQELREQLAQARLALAAAREAGDEDGVDAYRGRITGLLRIAAHHGIELPHTPEEEDED